MNMNESIERDEEPKRLHSFTMYYLKSAERLKQQGKPKCANYPYLNNLINGLTYVYFKEVTKPSEALLTKLEDKRVVDCLQVYADCLSKEYLHVGQTLENLIKTAYQHIDFRSLPKTYLSDQEHRAGLDQAATVVEKLLMAVVDYQKLNYQILVHLALKIRDQIETLETNVTSVVLERFLTHESSNCFFGGLHILELIKVAAEFVKQVTETAGKPWPAEELKALQTHAVRCEILSAEVRRLRDQAVLRFLKSPEEACANFGRKEQELAEGFEEKLGDAKRKLTSSAVAKPGKPLSEQGNSARGAEQGLLEQKEEISLNIGQKSQRRLLYVSREPQADDSHQLHGRDQDEKQLENLTNLPFFWLEPRNYFVQLGPSAQGPPPESAKQSSEVLHLWVILARNLAFLVFYYGQLPVFWVGLKRMAVPAWLLGFLFALTTLFSLLSNYLFNKFLSDRYKLAFTLSGAVLLLAILLQILAGGLDSAALLVLARIAAGFAEGLVITDTYIVRVSPEDKKAYFGYLYIGSHGLAISLGCGLSALLGALIPEYRLGRLRLDATNYLSIFLFFFYVPGLLIFHACFNDPLPKQGPAAPVATGLEDRALRQLDPYEFDLSEISEMTVLPPVLSSKKTFDEAVLLERKQIKKQDLEEKIRYAKRYFLKDQTNYIAGFMFVMHTIHECAIIETPFVLSELKQLDSAYVGLYFFAIFPVLLGFSLGHWAMKKKYTNGHIFRFFIISLFCSCIIKFQFTREPYPLAAIFIGSTLVLALSMGAESSALSVLTELVSEHHVEKKYGVGFKKSMLVAGGRGLAGFMVSFSLAVLSRDRTREPYMNAIIYGMWAAGLPVLFLCLLRVMNRMDQTRL